MERGTVCSRKNKKVFQSQKSLGACYGLASAILFGLTTPCIKWFLPEVDLLPVAGLLYGGAGIGLGFFELIFKVMRPEGAIPSETPIQPADRVLLVGIILTGGLLGPLLMLYGLQRTSALVGSLLLNLEAPLTVLLAVTLFREHLGIREIGATMCIFGGAGLLSYGPGVISAHGVGIISIIGACACWAIDNNLTQRLSVRNPLAVARVKGLSAGGFALGLAWLLNQNFPDAAAIGLLMGLGFVGYGVSVVLDIYALRLLGAAREAAFFATAPFIGAVAVVPLLGEHWTPKDYGAAAIMALGVGFLLQEHHRHMHTHPEMAHDHIHTHPDPHHEHEHEEDVFVGSHAHWHRHLPLHHDHAHVSDLHHRHEHKPY